MPEKEDSLKIFQKSMLNHLKKISERGRNKAQFLSKVFLYFDNDPFGNWSIAAYGNTINRN